MKILSFIVFVILAVIITCTSVSGQSQTVVMRTEWTAEYMKFRDEASQSFLDRSSKINDEYRLSSYPRWDFSQDTGQITFSDKGVKKLIANVQIAGDWFDGTWMWGWNNNSIKDSLKKDTLKVLEFGKKKNFYELITPELRIDPEYAWNLTAVAGQLINAKTAYRGENGDGFVYFLITDLKWVK